MPTSDFSASAPAGSMVNMFVNGVKLAKAPDTFKTKDIISKEYVDNEVQLAKQSILGFGELVLNLDTLKEIGGYLQSSEGQGVLNLAALTSKVNDNATSINIYTVIEKKAEAD